MFRLLANNFGFHGIWWWYIEQPFEQQLLKLMQERPAEQQLIICFVLIVLK